ncbi:hypothetical protein BSMD_008820 [Bacillus subtilis Miyagi-4]|nr:hypothetical protein BSMD_008820 [Bacillus subtilis Miyagi-4]
MKNENMSAPSPVFKNSLVHNVIFYTSRKKMTYWTNDAA